MRDTGFTESYKRLEKLCSEIYGVSAYIRDMEESPYGSRCVPLWKEDLRHLKKYRDIRNKISHEPGYSEGNMCERGDAQWLDNFRSRIYVTNRSACPISQSIGDKERKNKIGCD